MRVNGYFGTAVLMASFVNAVPSLAELRPLETDRAPIDDDLMGSGYETGTSTVRLCAEHPTALTTRALKAILAARARLVAARPELGHRLIRELPRVERDDTVGSLTGTSGCIRFNRSYVASLTPGQLVDHLTQLALALGDPKTG